VMLNIRHESLPRQRAVSIGPDGVTGWDTPKFDPALPDPVCMGSLVRSGNRLLFSNPHNPSGRERRNLTVKASDDWGRTWPVAMTIEPGPSGYSDLAAGADGTVFCLYERGGIGGNAARPEALTVARLKMD
jgi:sialidase-1